MSSANSARLGQRSIRSECVIPNRYDIYLTSSTRQALLVPPLSGTKCAMNDKRHDKEARAQRLREARMRANFKTAPAAARANGWVKETYKAHESGRNGFNAVTGKDYARKFGVSFPWLMHGIEPEELRYEAFPEEAPQWNPQSDQPLEFGAFGYAPSGADENRILEIDVRLGAGEGSVGEVVNIPVNDDSISTHRVVGDWRFPDGFLKSELRVSPRFTLAMEVTGDSMSPTFHPGDRVIVDTSQTNLVADTIYVISDGDSPPQIKRLQRVPFSKPLKVRIISDNSNYKMDTVEFDKLTIIGRVCGHIARK